MPVLKYRPNLSFLIILLLGVLYITLPSVNNSLDSLAYAEEIRSGSYLFRPHHLLYNAFGYALAHSLNIKNTLSLMCFVNSIFAIACLFMMRSMLAVFTDDRKCAIILILLGSCFGFVRFATDNEAYIIPLFFSLWASKTILIQKQAFPTSLLASAACLFHQVHFFWWLGLLLMVFFSSETNRAKRTKRVTQYISGALIVPAVYLIVFYLTKHDSPTFIRFVFHDYYQASNVNIAFKSVSLLLIPISLMRSFIQVHGYFVPLIYKYFYFGIPLLISIACFGVGIFKMKGTVRKRRVNLYSGKFASAHLLIFIMQLLFAALSDGNAEFMVMLPFALALWFFMKYEPKLNAVSYLSSGLLIWNLFMAVVPYHFMELNPNIALTSFINKHPSEVYYVRDNVQVDNLLSYYYPGQRYNIHSSLKESLDSLMLKNKKVLTDVVNNSAPYSRASFVLDVNQKSFQNYLLEKKDSIPYDLGMLYITSITNKK